MILALASSLTGRQAGDAQGTGRKVADRAIAVTADGAAGPVFQRVDRVSRQRVDVALMPATEAAVAPLQSVSPASLDGKPSQAPYISIYLAEPRLVQARRIVSRTRAPTCQACHRGTLVNAL